MRAYSINELLAEKKRALYERTRPRDLYDVVYLLENEPEAFDFAHVRDLFRRKCWAKNLGTPSSETLLRIIAEGEELRSEWANMLAHQLPGLPKLDDMLGRLPELLRWIDEPTVALPETRLAHAPIPVAATPIAPAGIQYWGGGLPLETIRFAGANRLLVEFDYDGRLRAAEPYSLRRASTGNILLYAWERGDTHIRAFNVAKLHNVRSTNTSFTPRYRVEFSAQGPVSTPAASEPTTATRTLESIRRNRSYVDRVLSDAQQNDNERQIISNQAMQNAIENANLITKRYLQLQDEALQSRSARTGRPARAESSPTYVFECPYCQKRFRRTKNDPALGKHKRKDGYGDCPGRRGYLVSVQ
jgi:hypothetical protein